MRIDNSPHLVFAIGRLSPNGGQVLGSAFSVRSGVLATAAHVISGGSEGLTLLVPRHNTSDDYQDTGNNEFRSISLEISEVDPIRDIALLKAKEIQTPAFNLSNSDQVSTGDTVTTLGYPHTDQGRIVLTQFSAEIGAKILVHSRGIKVKNLVVNTQARVGQSGGPVISRGGNVVAMVTGSFAPGGGGMISIGGIDPATIHQTTHAVSAEYIARMLPDV